MVSRRAALLLLGGFLGGCLGRSLPIPPPTAAVQAVTECPRDRCPLGGVVVTLTGTAFPSATVIVDDSTAAQRGAGMELLWAVRAGADGRWAVTLDPQRDPGGTAVRAVQRGDTLDIWQITAPPESEGSLSLYVQVPR